jgi:hypothetical protein
MRPRRGAIAAALIGAQLTACASPPPPAGPNAETPETGSAVAIREDLSGHFLAVIGLKVQDDPPYFETPGTNFSCLRSFIDRRSGKTAHQLYVAASYDGNHDWSAAHDSAGHVLEFIPISRLEIACDRKDHCSYAEEFAAKLPQNGLTENRQGFAVTFTDRAGKAQTIIVSADQIAAQLTALAQLRQPAVSAAGGPQRQRP